MPKEKLQQMGLDVSGYGEFCDQFVIDNFGASAVGCSIIRTSKERRTLQT